MTLHPAIIALILSSLVIGGMVIYSAYYGLLIVRKWDLKSGSELQLSLERRTYLISTVLTYVFGFQLVSLFLYIFTADNLHSLFVGAMCAAGTLNVNRYGYPALGLKTLNFLLAGVWLILNYTDNRAYDYPLVKKKYLLLLAMTPFIASEFIVQAEYFLRLKADVITSCCGSLFSGNRQSVASEVSSLPVAPMKIAFLASLLLTAGGGIYFWLRGKGGYLFSVTSAVTSLIMAASVVSFISLYFYELPTHHCPFCILQEEYGHIGYGLYIALLSGAVSGIGVGVLMPFRKVESLSETIPLIQKRLALLTLVAYGLFAVIVAYRIVFSNLILE